MHQLKLLNLMDHYINDSLQKRELSKQTVLQFNEVIKSKISEEQLINFIQVAEIINEQILEKEIFDKNIKL